MARKESLHQVLTKIEKTYQRLNKSAAKQARVILRHLKVRPLEDLWAEVCKTASRDGAQELANAYLLALARRTFAEWIAKPEYEPETRMSLARRAVNHQRRLDGIHPLPAIPGGEALGLGAPAREPAALPAGTPSPCGGP